MPDYSQPGDDGGATPAGKEVDWTVPGGDLRFPRPLECNVVYAVTATVDQPVETCAGVDFGPLWSRANSVAFSLLEEIQCPDTCGQRKLVEFGGDWDCRNGVAYARTKRAVVCLGAGPSPPLPDPVDPPTEDDLKSPGSRRTLEDLTETREIWIAEHHPAGTAVTSELPCESSHLIRFRFEADVHRCPPPSFEPFVDAARASARLYPGRGGCRAPCVPRVTIHRTQWHCVGRLRQKVEVNVYATVECRRP